MAGTRLFAVIAIFLPFLFFLPLVLKLTSVFRSTLPEKAIRALSTPPPIAVQIHMIQIQSSKNKQDFLDISILSQETEGLNVHVTTSLHEMDSTDITNNNVEDMLSIWGNQHVEAFDSSYVFFLICNDEENLGKLETSNEWTMGKERHGWWIGCSPDAMKDPLLTVVQHILPSPVTVQAEARVALSYRISFTLLNENPSQHQASWDFSHLASRFLQPFMDKVKEE